MCTFAQIFTILCNYIWLCMNWNDSIRLCLALCPSVWLSKSLYASLWLCLFCMPIYVLLCMTHCKSFYSMWHCLTLWDYALLRMTLSVSVWILYFFPLFTLVLFLTLKISDPVSLRFTPFDSSICLCSNCIAFAGLYWQFDYIWFYLTIFDFS